MKKVIYMLCVLSIISCKNDDFDIENLNGNKIEILGHGGMGIGQVYPINSYESILNAISLGVDGIEIDVQMTRDSTFVAFHDGKLEEGTDKSGRIYEKDWNDISDAEYKDPIYTNYQIISLDELFSNLKNKDDYTFFFDCKNFNPDISDAYLNTFSDNLISLIDKYSLDDNVLLEFSRRDVIESIKNKRPTLKVFANYDFEEVINDASILDLYGAVVSIDELSTSQVNQAHINGLRVATFNTHSKQRNIDAIERNVDYIITDRVKHLIKILK